VTFRRVEINGRAAGVEDLSYAAMVNYGHFTVMQVRAGKVRGLKLHLQRLDTATQELFGTNLDRALVREYLRHALRDTLDASVRISIFSRSENADPLVMVTVRAPMNTANTPQRLMTVRYRRELPHIKHVGTFGQIYYARLAEQHGFDDALFVGTDGNISETTIANIGFFEGDTIVWPDSPALEGITMQLVEKSLAKSALSTERSSRIPRESSPSDKSTTKPFRHRPQR